MHLFLLFLSQYLFIENIALSGQLENAQFELSKAIDKTSDTASADEDWAIYRDYQLGISFMYPSSLIHFECVDMAMPHPFIRPGGSLAIKPGPPCGHEDIDVSIEQNPKKLSPFDYWKLTLPGLICTENETNCKRTVNIDGYQYPEEYIVKKADLAGTEGIVVSTILVAGIAPDEEYFLTTLEEDKILNIINSDSKSEESRKIINSIRLINNSSEIKPIQFYGQQTSLQV
jgi:hypothetical protein